MTKKPLPPLVSVIIPCYNRERYIQKTVDSVLQQTYPNIEVIAVDDGCTDNTREILDRLREKVTVLEHPGRINKGQSAAINLGLRMAAGDYIAILDSDDLFLPDKIEKQVNYLEKRPEIGIVYTNGYGIDENDNRLYSFYDDNHSEPSNPEKVLMNCYFSLPSNALTRNVAFQTAGYFDESLRSAQDHDMAIRLCEVTQIGYLNECLFCYRRHQNSISSKNAELRWKNGFKILKKASKRYNYSLTARRKRYAVLNFRLGQCYWENNRLFAAAFRFTIAGLADPVRSLAVMFLKEKVSGPH
ncbi:MAG: glycosyltransferase [Thermodesulfobacteriota bacterium]|nr:glycosyltransferase [Thermodesulfobacteriota bacterium]